MAFNLFTRQFWRRRRQLRGSTFIAPRLPDPELYAQPKITLTELAKQDDANFFFLGCLPWQGSYSLKIPSIPLDLDTSNFKDFESYVRRLPGFASVVYEYHANTFDFVVDFSTAEEAAMALATHPAIDIGNGTQQTFQYADMDISEPSRKRMRIAGELDANPSPPLPHCQICCDELRGPYVRPCLSCKSAWCYDCVKSDFTAILGDLDRFPARCCGKVKHYDVARGIITTAEYNKYRSRFEEFSTTRPVYCANMRCSTFLPARISPPDERGRIHCSSCQTITCKECRAVFNETSEHKCGILNEMTEMLKTFDYKRCPRCNTAVAKMFGCSHMRCQCGAHFCWDCQRPIHICWSRPCERAREDGNETDESDHLESDSEDEEDANPTADQPPDEVVAEPNTQDVAEDALTPESSPNGPASELEQEQATSQSHISPITAEPEEPPNLSNLFNAFIHIPEPTHFETPPDAPPHTPVVIPIVIHAPPIERTLNLDGADREDWEVGDYDFGDEPIDETWDTWGCLHHFLIVPANTCKEWVPITTSATSPGQLERHVDCMRCFSTVVFDEKTEVQRVSEEDKDEETENKDDKAPLQQPPAPAPATSRKLRGRKKQHGKQASETPKLFKCVKCGIFHCTNCKKVVAKELELQRNSPQIYI